MPAKWSPDSYRDRVSPQAHNRIVLDDAAVVDRYVGGESENAIAKSLGVNRFVIRRRLLEAGVRPRSQSSSERVKWASMSADQRAAQIAAAHDATRGRKASRSERENRAATVEELGISTPMEARIMAWLRDRGEQPRAQVACGPYNIDIAVRSVAVELFGGGWHAHGSHRARAAQRARDLFDAGWQLLIIWTDRRRPLGEVVADHIIAFAEETSSDPTRPPQYRVIWGNGQFIAAGSAEDDYLAVERP